MSRFLADAPLLIDFGGVPACHCDAALDGLYKAMAEDPDGDPRSVWTPHDNPFLSGHVEAVTGRLQAVLERIQDALARLLLGEPIGALSKAAAVPWMRWQPERFEAVRAELEAKSPAAYTLEDWMLVVDYLIQRYLPDGVIANEAEYLTVRAAILGKVQAASGGSPPLPPEQLAAWTNLVPTRFAEVPPRVLSPYEIETMGIARTRAALHISNVTEAARARMKELVVEHVQAQVLGQREGTNAILKTRLFDEFGQLNRDFRRIAVTEAGECCNQGFIAALQPGARVTRREAYRGACKFCRSINGRTFRVVRPDDPKRDGIRDVWIGKTNAGRSAAPNKRVGGLLTERGPDELWWPAAGVQHPNCRGAWIVAAPEASDAPPAGVSPEFQAYMAGLLARHRAAVAVPGYEV